MSRSKATKIRIVGRAFISPEALETVITEIQHDIERRRDQLDVNGRRETELKREFEFRLLSSLDLSDDILSEQNIKELVEKAQTGNEIASAMVCAFACRRLFGGEALPPPVNNYIVDLLWQKVTFVLQAKKGRPKKFATQHRDLIVFSWMEKLLQRFPGLLPTQGREKKNGLSASTIVTEGFKRAGLHISRSRIEEIWTLERKRA
jgi:hypothetical protein